MSDRGRHAGEGPLGGIAGRARDSPPSPSTTATATDAAIAAPTHNHASRLIGRPGRSFTRAGCSHPPPARASKNLLHENIGSVVAAPGPASRALGPATQRARRRDAVAMHEGH